MLASIGSLEFFYDQAPDVMRSCCMALQLLSVAIGSYLSGALVRPDLLHWCSSNLQLSGSLQMEFGSCFLKRLCAVRAWQTLPMHNLANQLSD